MSLRPQSIPPIPSETVTVAKAAFPKGNLYLQIRDNLGSIYEDEAFSGLFSSRGKPAQSPWQLALVCIMQFLENLSDRQAADAVRSRIDWKYVLSLSLSDAGFDYSLLSEFRSRLIQGNAEHLLLDRLLEEAQQQNLLKTHKKQRTDSTHILASIRVLNRLETLGETFRATLNNLTVVAPDWLASHLQEEWFERYGRRIENYRLPKLDSERETLASTIGKDGFSLLTAIDADSSPEWLRQIPAVKTLRQVWIQQFHAPTSEEGHVQWRLPKEMPPSTLAIHSPYDVEAHYSSKRSVNWVGYKVHLTEVCDNDTPHLITNVKTTISTQPDDAVVESIHQNLSQRNLLPEEHFVDGGYMTSQHLVHSQNHYGVNLVGPVRGNPSWQSKTNSQFSTEQFQVDWENRVATCPKGHQSIIWRDKVDNRGLPVIHIHFSQSDCRQCRVRKQCTHSQEARRITLPPQVKYKVLQERRQIQNTPAFLKKYNRREGIEATISQGVRRSGLRRSRYLGLAKTHLQHLLSAVALNLIRIADWLSGVPPARTRYSRFTTLKPLFLSTSFSTQ